MIPLARPSIGVEEVAAVVEVLESGMLAGGRRVAQFEEEFARLTGTDHAVAVGSGTAALHIGLLALGLEPGDEVIVPSFTFAASANSIVMAGGTPVFVDVDESDFTMHADAVRQLINENTKAVMPVHLYGQPAPMQELMDLADHHGIEVVEDAAQAHLAMSGSRRAGSFGIFGAFSFYPTKNMTTGEGGMITTSDPGLAERARWLRNQGMAERYVHKTIGLNERMTEIEAAIGLVQLTRLPEWTERRRAIADMYRDQLKPDLGLPVERPDARHVYHQFTLRLSDRSPIISALEAAGIGYDIYYPRGTHELDPYTGSGYDLPITERLTRQVLSIPIRPDLTSSEIDLIISTLNRAAS